MVSTISAGMCDSSHGDATLAVR